MGSGIPLGDPEWSGELDSYKEIHVSEFGNDSGVFTRNVLEGSGRSDTPEGKGTCMCHDNVEWLHHVLGHLAGKNKEKKSNQSLKVKRQFEKVKSQVCLVEGEYETYLGRKSHSLPPAGHEEELEEDSLLPKPPLPSNIRRGRAPPLPTPPNPSLRRHHHHQVLLPPPPRDLLPSSRVGVSQTLAAGCTSTLGAL